jgi:hypothetical protein
LSAKIEQIVEVIEEVRERSRSQSHARAIHRMRFNAIQSIAARRGITYQSVNDKFIRKLRPDISGLPEFDDLLEKWLVEGKEDLKTILLRHASSYGDRELIQNAFYVAPEADIPLAQEFGFDPNATAFKEGKEQFRLHLAKERNRYLVNAAKELWLSANPKLQCEVCGFSFAESYGELGGGFIEAHHKNPIETLAPDTIVRIDDLAPVCSNCHSMLHRRRPWLTVEQLKELMHQQSTLVQPIATK